MEREPKSARARGDEIQFDTGAFSGEEAEAILEALPIDITFVDRTDAVRYFNRSGKRIFARTKSIIGTKVQQCHPQKSVHIVNKILESFKAGKKDVAEFWITMGGKLIHIRYLPIRDRDGNYLGTIEVTQDITRMRDIKGERRLLDWRD
jgi:PAS domain S-box-containing protein